MFSGTVFIIIIIIIIIAQYMCLCIVYWIVHLAIDFYFRTFHLPERYCLYTHANDHFTNLILTITLFLILILGVNFIASLPCVLFLFLILVYFSCVSVLSL